MCRQNATIIASSASVRSIHPVKATYNAVFNCGPFEQNLLQPLVRHHQTFAAPPNHLQPICPLGTEHIDRTIL